MPLETINETTDLIQVEELNPIALFTEGALDAVLDEIESRVRNQVPDISTSAGRKAIASLARKVASSKVILDDLGKHLVADWKNKAKKVDVERKKARDRLDALKLATRQPLTDWEAEQERIAAQKELERQMDVAWDEAHAEYEQREEQARRERELAEREEAVRKQQEEMARQEAERQAKEEAERQAREQKEREERIAREAAEKAQREAEEKIQQEKERAERAEREKEAAVLKAKQEAEENARRERAAELELEAQRKADAEKKAANTRHRNVIRERAISALADKLVEYETEDDTQELARYVVTWIDDGEIEHVQINY